MPLDKYKFNAGEKYPAVSANSIDPDSILALVFPKLTGANTPSAYSVFETLRAGANNGKFNITIDGEEKEVSVDLNNTPNYGSEYKAIDYGASTDNGGTTINSNNSDYVAQAFNTGNITRITAVEIYFNNNTGNNNQFTFELRAGAGPSGTLLASKQEGLTTHSNGLVKITFDTPVDVAPNTVYTIVAKSYRSADPTYVTFSGRWTNATSDGYYANTTSADTTKRLKYNIYAKAKAVTSLADVAVCVQIGLRSASGNNETVAFVTNHFEITGEFAGHTFSLSKASSPASGTDISGNGATKYLDIGTSATLTDGDGDDYNLVRLNRYGKVPSGALSIGDTRVFAKAGSYSLTTSFATVVYTTEVLDVNSEFNISTGIFTASKAGYYLISAGTGKQRDGFNTARLKVVKNVAGTPEILGGCIAGAADGGSGASSVYSGLHYLSAGDTICVQMRQQTWNGAVEDTGEGTFPYLSIIGV